MKKTNAMRILDQQKISYKIVEWDRLSVPHAPIYKTLVTVGKSGNHFVFVIDREHALDLKKAAQAVGEKHIHMLKEKDLLPLTGYVHGGCSPVGMKKHFATILDASALSLASLLVSGGHVGLSVEVSPDDLIHVVKATVAEVQTTERIETASLGN